jgi:hypothetical protein
MSFGKDKHLNHSIYKTIKDYSTPLFCFDYPFSFFVIVDLFKFQPLVEVIW